MSSRLATSILKREEAPVFDKSECLERGAASIWGWVIVCRGGQSHAHMDHAPCKSLPRSLASAAPQLGAKGPHK